MKLKNQLVYCPICHVVLEEVVPICNDCSEWGRKNGVDLLDRLDDDE
jgi:hypothetical protein